MKILVRLPNWLGDGVMSTAFINAVKEIYPDADLDIIIKKELVGISPFIAGVNKVHTFSKKEYKGLSGVYRYGKKLRTEGYDLAFNLPASLSSLLMLWATRAKKRIGFRKEGGIFFLTNAYQKPGGLHRVDEYLSLLSHFAGLSVREKKVWLSVPDSKTKTGRILVNFNSEASSRRMPVEKAKSVVNLITNTYKHAKLTFIGSPKEAAFIAEILNSLDNQDRIENLAGKTDLQSLCVLMAASPVMLSTDSGPAHLANSMGTPVIALFGAGNEHNTAPYNEQNLTVLRYGKLNCEPCVNNTCKLYDVPKCMQLIEELQIIDALRVYLPYA